MISDLPDPHGVDRVFCPLPWTHLCARLDGIYARCCVDASAQTEDRYRGARPERLELPADAVGCSPGSVFANDNPAQVMSLEAAFNSTAMRATRLAMLAGEPSAACRDCYLREAYSGDSYRLQMMRQANAAPTVTQCRSLTADDGRVDGFPTFLDLRLGNHCNLRCVMCDTPTSSSIVARDQHTWLRRSLEPYSTDEGFWRSIEDNAATIRSLYLAGGEPLLLRGHRRLLRLLIDLGRAGDIDLTYATNLTRIPPETMRMWREYRSVSLEASCDGVGEVFERIRVGGRWADFVRNADLVKDQVVLSIHASPQRDNVLHLEAIIDWALDRGLAVHVSNVVREPARLSVRNLPPDTKARAVEYLAALADRLAAQGEHNVAADVRGVLGYVNAPPDVTEADRSTVA